MQPTNYTPPIRIVIADDHCLFRQGLISVINKEEDMVVVDEAQNGEELLCLVEKHKPDIVITDIKMPKLDGIEAASLIAKKFQNIGVIILSMYEEEELITKVLATDAKGYLLKDADSTELITAIRKVYQKATHYSDVIFFKLFNSKIKALEEKHESSLPALTDQEIKVIKLICNQQTNKEIADNLDLTLRSVVSARERIQNKTGAKNMVGIVIFALKFNIVLLSDICDLIN